MGRLILKLLFKATLPLALLVGVLSYGVHLRGGDPLALLRTVGSGIGDRVAALPGSASDGVRDGFDAAGQALTASESDMRTRVYTWQDEGGVTHYATERPAGTDARTLSIDPNVNVLAPLRPPVTEPPPLAGDGTDRLDARADQRYGDRSDRQLAERSGAPSGTPRNRTGASPGRTPAYGGPDASSLPGVAGATAGFASGVSPEQAARVLKMLQGR